MKRVLDILHRWPVVIGALIAAGIVHICTTLTMPEFYRATAYARLARALPDTSFVILPLARPKAQVLPFQVPDSRYAICRFDMTDGAVAVRAILPEAGWTLTAYTNHGESFYALPASEQRKLGINLLIMPPGDRFLGALAEARNTDVDTSHIVAPSRSGLIVIQAPLKGRTYVAEQEKALALTSCRKQRF